MFFNFAPRTKAESKMSERERGSLGLLTLAEIRELDLIGYLSELGFEPVKVHSADHWYLSPLRDERTASFKVNRRLNRWYDHGISLGGNLIDFATIFYQCSVGEVIKIFSDYWSFHKPKILLPSTEKAVVNCPIQILYTGQLTSKTLLDYIFSRSVSPDIARQYCQQVNYQIGDRRYFAIGLLNNSGGYELRNSYSKLASSPKHITTINVGAPTVSVFEGMFDFLSYKTLMRKMAEQPENYVILNSISLFDRARPFLESHYHIDLYLDRDAAGIRCTSTAKDISEKYNDASGMYPGYKDLNEWLKSTLLSRER